MDREPQFQFSLTRQIPMEDGDEYDQIHLDVYYEPSTENSKFCETTWNDCLNENIFDYIRRSTAFDYCQRHKYVKTKVWMSET